jgi:hypothetical protein
MWSAGSHYSSLAGSDGEALLDLTLCELRFKFGRATVGPTAVDWKCRYPRRLGGGGPLVSLAWCRRRAGVTT